VGGVATHLAKSVIYRRRAASIYLREMHRAVYLLLWFFIVAPRPGHAAFTAAFCERDITPAIGMEVPGGYGKAFSKKIHDACKVRAVVFDNGAKRVALFGVDALMLPRQLVIDARARIEQRCGIKPDAILIGASHSHSSGPTGMVQPGEFDHASEEIKVLAYQKSSCADAGYLERVRDAIVDAVVTADSGRRDATLGFGTGREANVAFNRRIKMKNGATFSHPGKGNPGNVDYAGPTDPGVGVIGAWDADGKLLGCVVNFACHATASGPWISANWIHYMEKMIQGYFGPETRVVFLQGACGDVTQVDNLDPTINPESDAWSQSVGGRVGAEAVKVLLGMSRARAHEVTLEHRHKVWRIPRRTPSAERVGAARALIERDETKNPDWVWAKETLLLEAMIAKEPEVEVEVQAVQICPVLCVANPAEYFCRYGLELKKGSGFPMTFPVELANGCVGYVPTRDAFDERSGGGYETRLTSYSNLEISAGEQFRDAGLALARQFTPDKLPQVPMAPAFKAPWSYGNVPPQVR
jgi:hypothetical protein